MPKGKVYFSETPAAAALMCSLKSIDDRAHIACLKPTNTIF